MPAQQELHIAPRLAAASGSGQRGGPHDIDVAPLAPVAPLAHGTCTNGQMQAKIAGRPVGCHPAVPVSPVGPLAPVEPVAGHGLHATDEIAT